MHIIWLSLQRYYSQYFKAKICTLCHIRRWDSGRSRLGCQKEQLSPTLPALLFQRPCQLHSTNWAWWAVKQGRHQWKSSTKIWGNSRTVKGEESKGNPALAMLCQRDNLNYERERQSWQHKSKVSPGVRKIIDKTHLLIRDAQTVIGTVHIWCGKAEVVHVM